jgi:hypothetical protein
LSWPSENADTHIRGIEPLFPWAFARKGSPAMDEHSHTEPPSEPTLRIRALESLLVEKGLVDPGAVDEIIELFEKRIGPRNGAKVASHSPSPTHRV